MLMNLMLKIVVLSSAALTVFGAAGCKVTECTETEADGGTVKKENCLQIQTTVEYRDARLRTGGQAWMSGQAVTIANHNGPLRVAPGAAGDERVAFSGTAFTRETNDAAGAQKAKDHLGMMADPAFSGTGMIILDAPGGGVDGYDLIVWIPPDFDAALKVTNENGTTTLDGADGTTTTTVTSHGIIASNLKRSINLVATVGDIQASGAPSGANNRIRAENGKIDVTLGAANLTVTAKTDLGVVYFPMTWMSSVSSDKTSGSATLGDGTGALDVSSGLGDISFFAQ
jgi:hypothetical protein